MINSLLYPSILDFSLLAIISYIVRARFMRENLALTGAGGIVMAIGVVGLYVLPYLPSSLVALLPYVALELFIVWLFLVASLIQCYTRSYFHIHTRSILNRFTIGTWVVGSALLAVLLLTAFPEWYEVSWPIGVMAIAIWIAYMHHVIDDLWRILCSQLTLQLNGNIFLATASVQSIVILLSVMTPGWIPKPINMGLIIWGYVFYAVCLGVILRNYSHFRLHNLVVEWSHTNCMMYGALALSGMAVAATGALPNGIIVLTWCAAVGVFLVVEGLGLARLSVRVRKKHIVRGALNYDVTQWLRIFAYGALYGCTADLQYLPETSAYIPLQVIADKIMSVGPYVITLLVVVEIAIFFRAKIRYHALKAVRLFQ